MRNYAIGGAVLLGLVLVIKWASYSIDVTGLENDAALLPINLGSSSADVSPEFVAGAVAAAAGQRGFELKAEDVRVVRKPMRVGYVNIVGAVSVKSHKPDQLHDFVIDATVRRSLFLGLPRTAQVHVETVGYCTSGEGAGAGEVAWPKAQ